MKFIYRNLLRSVLTHWKSNLLILSDLILCAVVLFVMMQNTYSLLLSYKTYAASDSYATFYSYSIEGIDVFQDLASKSEMLDIAGQIQRELVSTPLWYDSSCSPGCIAVSVFDSTVNLPESFLVKNRDDLFFKSMFPDSIPTICITPQVFDAFTLKLEKGSAFPEEAYWQHEDQTPIILGYDYLDYYDIGDQITSQKDTGIVIGFMAKNSYVMDFNGEYILLDKVIITPRTFPSAADSINFDITNRMITGTILVRDSNIDLQQEINKITSKYGFYPISVTPMDGNAYTNTMTITQKNLTLLIFLTITSSILSITALCNILYKRTKSDNKTFSIFILSGISLWKIRFSIAVEMFVYAGLSILPSIAISYLEFKTLKISPFFLLAFILLIVAVSLIPVFRITGKINLDTYMQIEGE